MPKPLPVPPKVLILAVWFSRVFSLDALATGDEVVTTGGIFGEITNKKDDRFVIRIADNTKVEVGKSFITALVKKAG